MNAIVSLRTTNRIAGLLAPDLTARVARRELLRPRRAGWARAAGRDAPEGAVPVTFRFGHAGLRWGSTGPVVLMMHGWGGRAAQFHAIAQALAARGLQAIALDGPAHGRTRFGLAHPASFAEALHEAAAELRDVHAVVGHSMGAGAALLALSEGLATNRAVSIAAAARMTEVLWRFAAAFGLPEGAGRRFVQGVERAVGRPAAELDVARMARGITVPGLVVHDLADRQVPYVDAQRVLAAWPSARLVTTDGLGHNRILSDASVVATVADFVAGRQG